MMKTRMTMSNPPEEADNFSVGENSAQIVHMDDNDKDDEAAGDEGIDDRLASSLP
jgi:hypothetical protein